MRQSKWFYFARWDTGIGILVYVNNLLTAEAFIFNFTPTLFSQSFIRLTPIFKFYEGEKS